MTAMATPLATGRYRGWPSRWGQRPRQRYAARAGGEEFVMLLPGVPMAAAVAAAHRLRLKIATSPNPDLSAHPITLSAGVAHYPTHGATLEAVYQRADQALYYAKNHGRNAVAAADDLVRGGMRNTLP